MDVAKQAVGHVVRILDTMREELSAEVADHGQTNDNV
jgi:hypothetical protein